MQWDRIPPRTPEECRFRTAVGLDATGEFATCGLVREALPLADEQSCRARRDACVACCDADPATPAIWNPVVASLAYQAASDLAARPDRGEEALRRADDVRQRAINHLDVCRDGGDRREVTRFDRLDDLLPAPAPRRRARISKWAVGVTTSPRRQPTLDQCLDHLTRAGWQTPHLFMDGAVRIPERYGHLPGTLRSPAVGAFPNHYLALCELTLREPHADAFLIFQDDAIVYDGENVREYLERTLWPGDAAWVASLYCADPYTASRFGWHRLRGAWIWGALAFVFSRAAAQKYLRDWRVCRHRWGPRDWSSRGGLTLIDCVIGRWARRRRVPVWFPTPSLVQHIGETSTLYMSNAAAGPRVAKLFVGAQGRVHQFVDTPDGHRDGETS